MPLVEVPSRYRVPTRGEGRIAVKGSTIRACIEEVDDDPESVACAEGSCRLAVATFLLRCHVSECRSEIDNLETLAKSDCAELDWDDHEHQRANATLLPGAGCTFVLREVDSARQCR